jgi:hypothetical protein
MVILVSSIHWPITSILMLVVENKMIINFNFIF